MTHLYADTSALVRSYLRDESGHADLRALLLDGVNPVVSSELTRLEFRSAMLAAGRAGRLPDPMSTIRRFDADCGEQGVVELIALDVQPVVGLAMQLVERHPLHAVDAIHLAVAIEESVVVAPDGDLVFVTRGDRQRGAALAEGLRVA